MLIGDECFNGVAGQYGQPNCGTTDGGPKELLLRLIAVPAEHDNVISVH